MFTGYPNVRKLCSDSAVRSCVLCVREIRLACLAGGDRRKMCLAWRPRDPNLRNGQQLGSNISSPSLFFGVPKGSLALRYTSSLWGLFKHWDGAFFHTAASQPRGRIFCSIASWSSIHTEDQTLASICKFCIRSGTTRLASFVHASRSRLTFITCTSRHGLGPTIHIIHGICAQ